MPKKEQKKTIDKSLINKAEQLSNQYIVYEQRLSERAILSPDEREAKIHEFLELYKDEFTDIMFGLVDNLSQQKKASGGGFNIDFEEAIDAGNLTKEQTKLLKQYLKHTTGEKIDRSAKIEAGSYLVMKSIKDDIKKGAKYDTAFKASEAEPISAEAVAGTREIMKWLYKHSEIRTAAAEGSKMTGSKSMMQFIEAIAGRPVSQQAKIFYLVCVNHTKQCTPHDLEEALTSGPTLEAFKKSMNKSKARFFTRIAGNKIKWDKLSAAIVLLDEKLQHGEGFVEANEKPEDVQAAEENLAEHEEEVRKEKDQEKGPNMLGPNDRVIASEDGKMSIEKAEPKEKDQEGEQQDEDEQDDVQHGGVDLENTKVKPFFDAKAMQEIEEIEKILKNLKNNNSLGEKDKKKAVEILNKKLNEILEKQQRLLDGCVGIEDPKSWVLEMGTYAGSAATVLNNTKVMDAAMGIAIATDALTIASKIVFLVRNYKDLSPKECARQAAYIGMSAVTITKDITKLVELTDFVKAGLSVKDAGNALAGSSKFNSMSNVFGVVTGTATVIKGAQQAHEAENLKKGAGKAEEKLGKAQNLEGDGALYANDLTKYARSQAKCRAAKASYNIVNGAISTISSIFNLTGLGAIVGIPMTLASYGAMAIGWLVKFFIGKKEKKKVLDRFFKIDDAVEAFNQRFVDYFNKMNKGKDTKEVPYKMTRSQEKEFREELRAYGESLIGVTSDATALNLIQTRYADYLWNTVFVNPKAQGGKKYWQASDYRKSTDELRQDELERYACRDLVSGMGASCTFSRNGIDKPYTSITEVKRHLVLE